MNPLERTPDEIAYVRRNTSFNPDAVPTQPIINYDDVETEDCPDCYGDGTQEVDCINCDGAGEVDRDCDSCGQEETVTCDECDGTGYFTDDCDNCGGDGYIEL